jgi:hypothetical protein
MLSLRCRINANVAELLVIIGYSELGPTFEARPFALSAARSAACLLVRLLSLPHPVPPLAPLPVHPGLASSPVWSFPRLPRCCDSHWRASWWTAPIRSPRFTLHSLHSRRARFRFAEPRLETGHPSIVNLTRRNVNV